MDNHLVRSNTSLIHVASRMSLFSGEACCTGKGALSTMALLLFTLVAFLCLTMSAEGNVAAVPSSLVDFIRGDPLLLPAEEPALGESLVKNKAALSHLLLQAVFADELMRVRWLQEGSKMKIIERAETERLALAGFYETTQEIARSRSLTMDEKRKAIAETDYNGLVGKVMAESVSFVDEILGRDAGWFYAWLSRCWQKDRQTAERHAKTGGTRSGNRLTYTVYATQYFGETNYEAAIPDKYLKFANRGWSHYPGYEGSDYSVKLERAGWTVPSVLVWDVGPWNIDDNYWNPPSGHSRPRRMFTDLAQGMPEAQAAYYTGYNNGLDQFGRTVTVPTALDMTPALAADLGLGYLENDWVTVTYLWETGGGLEIVIDDSDPECTFQGPPQYWWEVTGYGMNNQMHYTYNIQSGLENTAVWSFDVPEAGKYEISVFIPRNYATATSARYYLNLGTTWYGPRTVNQNIHYDEWVTLVACWLNKGLTRVAVIDATGEPTGTTKIGVDAARIRKM